LDARWGGGGSRGGKKAAGWLPAPGWAGSPPPGVGWGPPEENPWEVAPGVLGALPLGLRLLPLRLKLRELRMGKPKVTGIGTEFSELGAKWSPPLLRPRKVLTSNANDNFKLN